MILFHNVPKNDTDTLMTSDLSKKVALVTGASRGLGAAIARSLAERGASAALNCFGSVDKAQATADEIIRAGGKAAVFKADVRDERQVAQMSRMCKSNWV